jgi:dipeptidyl aminopeptidase/acylaminoacyl peptidase
MPPADGVVLVGRVERSAVVGDTVRIGGVVVPDSLLNWTIVPGGAATILAPGRIKFVDTGAVTLIARIDTDSVVRVVHVAQPPLIYFDLQLATHHAIYRVALDGLDTARITLDTADNTEPTLAASGAMIFVSRRDGNGELYSAASDPGAAATRLTTTSGDEAAPRISHDGSAVAYTIPVGGIPKVYRAAANLSGTTQFTANFESSGAVDASPTWSPDGSMLAFVSTTSGPARLYRYHLGDAFDTLPGAATSGADVEPAWSPDGTRLAFASNRTGPTELYLLPLSGGSAAPITDDGGPNGEPAWTPDGRIVYVTWATGHPRLRWLDPAFPGSTHDIATPGDALHPALRPAQ